MKVDPRLATNALPIGWAGLLTLLIAGPWLVGGYIFGADWPGPRRFAFPQELSSSALLQAVLAVVSRVVSGEVTGKLLIFGLLFVAALTSYRAVPTASFLPRATASIVYLFNPFVFGRLHYGQLFLLAGYAVLPWVASRLRVLLRQPSVVRALVAAVALALLGILSLHLLLVAGVLAAALVATHVVGAKANPAYLKRLLPLLVLTIGSSLVVSAYWVIPVLVGSGPEGSVISGISSGDLVAYAAVPDQRVGLLPNLLGLYGFWAEGSGRFTSMKHFVPLWPAALAAILLLSAVGAFSALKRREDRVAPWVAGLLVAGAVAILLETGISQSTTAVLVRWLDSFPIYRGMRDAGKWAALIALVYSQLVALGAAAILGWIRKGQRGPLASEWLQGLATGLLLAVPLYYGNGLLFGMHGEINPSQYPSGWYAADRVLAADSHAGRTLFLPWHEYMALSFVRNENRVVGPAALSFFSQHVLVSSDPEVPGIVPPRTPDQVAVSSLISDGAQGHWAEVLAARGIKYVLLAREVDWTSYSYLDNQSGLVRIGDFGSIVLYRNTLVT